MKLTKAQAAALRDVDRYVKWFGKPFHKEQANGTTFSIRADVLEKLVSLGLIDSRGPMAFAFHTVTLTETGRAALKEMGE